MFEKVGSLLILELALYAIVYMAKGKEGGEKFIEFQLKALKKLAVIAIVKPLKSLAKWSLKKLGAGIAALGRLTWRRIRALVS